jgi:hypothetical protein
MLNRTPTTIIVQIGLQQYIEHDYSNMTTTTTII